MDIDLRKKNISSDGGKLRSGVVDLRRFAQPKMMPPEISERTTARKVFDIKTADKNALAPDLQKNEPEEATGWQTTADAAEMTAPQNAEAVKPKNIFLDIHKPESFGEVSAPDSIPAFDPANMEDEQEIASDEAEKISRMPSAYALSPRGISFSMPGLQPRRNRKKAMLRFAVSAFLIPAVIFSFSFAQVQLEQKGIVLGISTLAYNNLQSAAQSALVSDFNSTSTDLDSANMNFAKAQETINGIGAGIGETIAGLPISTPFSTAQNLTVSGENIALAGKDLNEIFEEISRGTGDGQPANLAGMQEHLQSAAQHLQNASDSLQKVDTKFIPSDMRDKIELAKKTLPPIARNFQKLSADCPLILKMLGANGPQKYLLLFENNTEMRATGGFIGSYGILDVENGKIQNLKIDEIFNPDGQLQEKIIPPMPIQKISASWSMHDANWFADFPTSAKEVALLYEKTGGPTVDGVIAVTPETIKKFLEITGPIELPEFDVTITSDNFIAQTQSQVENFYDKKENRPKKILAELAPVLLDKVLGKNSTDQGEKADRLLKFIQKTEEALQEKHILIYHRDEDVENMIQKRSWGGEVIQNEKGDYLSVVNSNINGYKTDAVVEEKIKLETEIQEDGTVIDTVTINRKHTGGDSEYDWYNRVNADYMRVYVPKGSVLLSASGNTVEAYNPPMDYSTFKTCPEVEKIEKSIKIDPDSQTQIFEESGKTVFGNWVYVSPKEEVTIVYKYALPFKINFDAFQKSADIYSALIQKQSGSVGSGFEAAIKFPAKWQRAWKVDKLTDGNSLSEKLSKDLVYGEVFTR